MHEVDELQCYCYPFLPVRHWKAYTEGTRPVGHVYLKPKVNRNNRVG